MYVAAIHRLLRVRDCVYYAGLPGSLETNSGLVVGHEETSLLWSLSGGDTAPATDAQALSSIAARKNIQYENAG